MQVDGSRYREIPPNRHQIAAGSILLPTRTPIVSGGGTSLDFIHQQGGCDQTFVLLLGQRRLGDLLGGGLEVLEGIFLTPQGPGFHPTWGYDQLLQETDLGGWKVIPTPEVLSEWIGPVEDRMNLEPLA